MTNGQIKQCPNCAAQISLTARFCNHCGAPFVISYKGYCSNCQNLVTTVKVARCPVCGTQVVDVHVESTPFGKGQLPIATQPPISAIPLSDVPVNQAASPLQPIPSYSSTEQPGHREFQKPPYTSPSIPESPFAPPTPPAPLTQIIDEPLKQDHFPTARQYARTPLKVPQAKNKNRVFSWIFLTLFCAAIGYFAYIIYHNLSQLAAPAENDAKPSRTMKSSLINETTLGPKPTRTPIPTITPTLTIALHPADNPGMACIKTSDGLDCLDSNGWFDFPRNDSTLSDHSVNDMAKCLDGSLAFNYGSGIAVTDGVNTLILSESGKYNSGIISCSSSKDIWFASYDGMAHMSGTDWKEFTFSDLPAAMNNEDYSNAFIDLVMTAPGKVVVIQNKTIARFTGSSWEILKEGKDFQGAAVDSQGQVWVSKLDGLLVYDGTNWSDKTYAKAEIHSPPIVDSSDRVWVVDRSSVYLFDPKTGWTEKKINTGLAVAKGLNALAIDSSGRMWLGTDYGLAVNEGSQWRAYHMHTADLKNNAIDSILISGSPTLPSLLTKPNGSLSGKLLSLKEANTNGITVEICVTYLGFIYSGATPCSVQPYRRSATTGSDGRFVISDLPTGFYVVTFKIDGIWKYMTTSLGIGSAMYHVLPGENFTMKDVVIDKE